MDQSMRIRINDFPARGKPPVITCGRREADAG
jgi:hypothetical protein